MRELYIVDTPFQTLNALNLRWHSLRAERPDADHCDVSDLYIIDQFSGAANLYAKIKETSLFRHVYLLHRETRRDLSFVKRKVMIAYDLLHPEKTIAEYLNRSEAEITPNYYDHIVASLLTHLVAMLLRVNDRATFDLIDDGSGSYSGNVIRASANAPLHLFYKVFGFGSATVKPRNLYINNAQICRSTAASHIVQAPRFDQEFLDFVYPIFGIGDDATFGTKNIIWISQPSDEISAADRHKEEMAQCLQPLKDHLLVRMHPRDRDDHFYQGFQLDRGKWNWELLISKADIDNLVLFGTYSTAQLVPKFIYDKEPTVVFTHYLSDFISEENRKMYDQLIAELKNSYRNPQKVVIVKSQEELLALLKEHCKK